MMSRTAIVINNVFMSLIFTLMFSLCGQYFGTGHIDLATLPPSFILGFIVGFCVVQFIPCVPLGMRISKMLKLKPNGFGSYLCICCCVSIILTFVMTFVMTPFGVSFQGGAPIPVGLTVALHLWGPFTLMAIVLALVITKPIQALARTLAHDKEPEKKAPAMK